MLTNLCDIANIEVVLGPHSTFMLKSFSSDIRGRVDAPLVPRAGLFNKAVRDEALNGLFTWGSGCEGPN